jgi:hypothetical protein
MFTLEPAEWESLRSQIAILNKGRGSHRKYPPLAFTEHGANMAAVILNSDRALQMSVYVIRALDAGARGSRSRTCLRAILTPLLPE